MLKIIIQKYMRLLLTVIAFFASFSTSFSQLQTKQLPVEVTCRKSLMGGSYVLQIKNVSSSSLNIWLDARGKVAMYHIPAGEIKEIGWAQGFRFDANDIFFIGADGYDIIKQSMPNAELSAIRFGFSNDGSLTINLSQSFLQNQLNKYIKVPIKDNIPRVLDLELNEMPQIILRDRSDRIHASAILQTITFSGKVHIPINVFVSFIPFYVPTTGEIIASQIKVDNINVSGLPQEWFNQITTIINKLIPIWFSEVKLYKLDNTILKYCEFFNVHQISVQNGRLSIELL